jgi:transposase
MPWPVAQDWRDGRIAELEAALAASEARNAAKDARIAELEQRVAELSKQLAELAEKLGQNSRNSHRPPSSDPPAARRQRRGKGKSKSQRKRGAQPGHRPAQRGLLPPEEVDETVHLFPSHCEGCAKPLPEVPDANAMRFEVTEVPLVKPHTTEYRRHAVRCSCGHLTCAVHDQQPASPFGPRLMALVALLTGVYHLSRRKAAELLSDLAGVRISVGAISNVEARVSTAVQPAVEVVWERVREAEVKHTDGTSWFQSGLSRALWTIATATATVFKIVVDGSKQTLAPLYGALHGILVSDRAKSLNFWAMEHRELLDYTGLVFEYWHDYKDGKLDRDRFIAWMAPVRLQVQAALQRAVDAQLGHVSGSCADVLAHAPALWTFVDREGVDPTNNHAERELRAFVLWRKRSFGTQSERGNLFAERLMTVAHTARKQRRHVLTFLTACCQAQLDDGPSPSVFEAPAAFSA